MARVSRILENKFFFQEDKILLEKQQALRQMKEAKEAIREVSGIQDEQVLQKLVDLNVRPETVASLVVVPLVEVAWANGDVDRNEKEAVLDAARRFGWSKDNMDYLLLERWLEHKPDAALLKAWVHYTGHLCARMPSDEVLRLKKEILSHAAAVAQASGGLLGIGKTSAEEKEMLAIIENAFSIKDEAEEDAVSPKFTLD